MGTYKFTIDISFLIIMNVVCSGNVHKQRESSLKDNITLAAIDMDPNVFKLFVVSERPSDSVQYLYHKNGNLKIRLVDSQGVRGFREYNESGVLEKVYYKIKGHKQGQYIRYFTNDSCKGQVYVISYYKDGKLNGLHQVYRPRPVNVKRTDFDSIVYKLNYVEDKLTGPTYTNYENKQYFLSYYHRDVLLIQYEYRILDKSSYYDLTILENKIKKKGLDEKAIKSELDAWMYLMPLSYDVFHSK